MVLWGMMPAELISSVKWWRMVPERRNLPAGVPSGMGFSGGAWGGHGRCVASSRGWPHVLGTYAHPLALGPRVQACVS